MLGRDPFGKEIYGQHFLSCEHGMLKEGAHTSGQHFPSVKQKDWAGQ